MNSALAFLNNKMHILRDMVCMSWLAGKGEKFSFVPRKVDGVRPLLCVTHVTADGRVLFGASISRPSKGRLEFRPLLDLHRPAEEILAHRYNPVIGSVVAEHVKVLARWAEQQERYPAPIPAPRWPSLLVPKVYDGESWTPADDLPEEVAAGHVNDEMIYEDFHPVLNARYWNPAKILARPANPAAEILGRHKLLAKSLVAYADQIGQEAADALLKTLVAEMREALPMGWRFTEDEILSALEHPRKPLGAGRWMGTVDGKPEAVITEMRALLKPAIAAACEDQDILDAAYNPAGPLVVAYRSELQVAKASDAVASLPALYGGEILPRVVDRSRPAPDAPVAVSQVVAAEEAAKPADAVESIADALLG